MTNYWECLVVLFYGVQMNLDDEESLRFFAEFTLSGIRFFASLRMTRSEGLRVTTGYRSGFLMGY